MKAVLFVLLVVALFLVADSALAQGYYGSYAYPGSNPRYGYGYFNRVGFTPYQQAYASSYVHPYMSTGFYYGSYGHFGYGHGWPHGHGGMPMGYGPYGRYGYW